MRYTILSILFIVCFAPSRAQQWKWQNPYPQGNNLKCIKFWDKNTGIAVGEYGTIIKTKDAGRNWSILTPGFDYDLFSVSFIDSLTIFAVGHWGIILKTSDGGSNWIPVNSVATPDLYSIDFADSFHGCTVGKAGTVLTTSDGGNTWIAQNPGYLSDLTSVDYRDNGLIYAVGRGGTILKSINAGSNWNKQSNPLKRNLWSVFFLDNQYGFCVGDSSCILKTVNGGISWSSFEQGRISSLNSVFFNDKNNGFTVSDGNGFIYKTTDGGNTWSYQYTPFSLNSIVFTDFNTGYITGDYGIIGKTVDNGAQWSTPAVGTFNYFSHSSFPDVNHGFVTGPSLWTPPYQILRTKNAGRNWSVLSSPTVYANGICFLDSTTGFIYDEKMVYKTFDGGDTWLLNCSTSDTNKFLSLFFTSHETGYLYCKKGLFLKTVDAGQTWTKHFTNIQVPLFGFSFINDTTGYCADMVQGQGNIYTIFKTTNGGFNWIQVATYPFHDIKSLIFISADTGYISGSYGEISKTFDGGKTWALQASGSLNDVFFSLSFINESTGYAVGTQGTIWKTTNGGALWEHLTSGTRNDLYNIKMFDTANGYICGEKGTILGTRTGSGTAIGELFRDDAFFKIYPNPAHRIVNVEINDVKGKTEVILYNFNGIQVLKKEITGSLFQLDLSDYTEGIYFLQLTNGNRTCTRKLIYSNPC